MARRLINKRDHKGNRPQHRTPHYGPGVAHATAARPSAIPPRKQLRWNTPGRGRSAPEINHILWDQSDHEVSDTKINSPDGVDQKLEGSDDDDVGSPLIIEEQSDSAEGLKTAEHYEDSDFIPPVISSDEHSAVSQPTNGSKSDDLDGPLLRHPPSRYPPITPTTPASVAFLYNTWNLEDWVRAGYKPTPNTAPAVRCETERRGAVAAPPLQTRCTSQETPVIPADQDFKCQEGDTEDSSPEPSDATLLAQVADNVAHAPDWGNNNRSYQTDPALVTELEEMYDDELRRMGIVTYPNVVNCITQFAVCRRMAERVHSLYKRGEATAHQIAFVVETSTPDSDGTPNFRLQQAVASTEITTSSDCHNITLVPPIGVTSHGNYRELFIGSSAEHPVDLFDTGV